MGLLDDAIREHLELKRLRGADPGEVAREQHEALDPVPRDERGASENDSEPIEGFETEPTDDEPPPVDDGYAPDHAARTSELVQRAEASEQVETSDDLRETAELDMRTLLDEEQGTPVAHASPATAATHDAPGEPEDEDSLEWEFPGDSADRPAKERGPHEHGSRQDDHSGMVEERAPAPARREDVMERPGGPVSEPPEQERLRFEQAPSREPDIEG